MLVDAFKPWSPRTHNLQGPWLRERVRTNKTARRPAGVFVAWSAAPRHPFCSVVCMTRGGVRQAVKWRKLTRAPLCRPQVRMVWLIYQRFEATDGLWLPPELWEQICVNLYYESKADDDAPPALR